MSALMLDAGAFVEVDRNDRAMVARLRVADRSGIERRSNGVVVVQVWRDPTGMLVAASGLAILSRAQLTT